MLPPPSVLTNKKCRAARVLPLLALALGMGLAGCGPPGPRALLDGEKSIKNGRYPQAVEQLRKAATLMPKDARVWNFLGLAHHGNQQPEDAIRAYQNAISLDRNLAAARYNLGCLYLEQNNVNAAATELYTFALLQPASVDGLLKLGTAHLRAKRLREAETCFKSALELQPRHPEALNNLGVIQVQRRNWQEAHNFFNLVLSQTNYAPALLNIAVVNQQGLNNRAAALKAYRQYLAVNPAGADRTGVEALVQQLDGELNPGQLTLHPVTPPPARTAAVAAVTPPVRVPTNPPAAPRTNPPAVAIVKPPAPTNPVVAVRTAPEPPRPPTNPVAVAKAPDFPATAITDDLVIKPAQDLTATRPPVPPPSVAQPKTPIPPPEIAQPKPTLPPSVVVKSPADSAKNEPPKRGFLARLNPFSRKPKEDAPQPPPDASRPATLPPAQPTALAPAPVVQPPPPPIPRYPFQNPAAPRAGNRAQGEAAFARGVKAHQSGNRKLAIDEYQNALRADPAWYDAYYNLGMAAQDTGALGLALIAYETALALKPDSADARYNFALALKTGGYAQDAVDQLDRLLRANPSEVRAHLSMANICAQQLRQPALAREHYNKVLELKPSHPEAAKIRSWLANNP